MATQVARLFPDCADEVQSLVNQHLALADEPLLLAIYYKPERDEQDVYLFEVVENFGAGMIDPDRELFEVVFNAHSNFGLEHGQNLHLILTNPDEFATALRENWALAAELRRAIEANDYRVLYSTPDMTI